MDRFYDSPLFWRNTKKGIFIDELARVLKRSPSAVTRHFQLDFSKQWGNIEYNSEFYQCFTFKYEDYGCSNAYKKPYRIVKAQYAFGQDVVFDLEREFLQLIANTYNACVAGKFKDQPISYHQIDSPKPDSIW